MTDIEKIFDKLDAISETVTRTDTKLTIIDKRGTTASVNAIKNLDDKYAGRTFKTMLATIFALAGVAWELLRK